MTGNNRGSVDFICRTCILALIAFALLRGSLLLAGSGEVLVAPPPGVRNSTGLEVAVDTQWLDGSGYRWVRVHVTTVGKIASPRDRLLRIEISPNSNGRHNRFLIARGFVELKQGAVAGSAGLLVPQSDDWRWIDISVFEGGTLRRELSTTTNHSSTRNGWSEGIPGIIVVDQDAPTSLERANLLARYNRNTSASFALPELPDLRGLRALVTQSSFYASSQNAPYPAIQQLADLTTIARLELLPPSDLPDQWPGLASVDIIIVPLGDLKMMAETHRPQFEAVLAWCAAGGNLVVYDVGEDYGRLAELETLCKISPVTKGGDFASSGWKPAATALNNETSLQVIRNLESNRYYYEEQTVVEEKPMVTDETDALRAGANLGSQVNPRFVLRPLSMGQVVALPAENPFPSDTSAWSWLLNELSQNRWMWQHRHGLSLQGANNDFWEFLVPGTGKAPVWPFCVMITLFAILIGPVNYFVLQRQKRLYLLLATIPLGAAVVTLGLFAYAIITDGLGTRLRVRSYTQIDQDAARAVNWSRQSYYASVAPASGLSFPSDAAVYPFEQFPQSGYSDGWERQRLYAWDEGQHFQSGYMSSRVATQFLVVHSIPSTQGIVFAQPRAPQQATNRLGAKIDYLLVRDHDGNYFTATSAADGATMALKPTEFAKQKSDLVRRMLANRPALPDGFDPTQLGGLWNNYRYRFGYGRDTADADSSLLETRLQELLNASKDTLSPGSYIAIVDKAPAAALGIAGARQEASFHVVEGTY